MLPYTTNLEHLRDELRRLDLLLEQAVRQFREQRNQPNAFGGLYISDTEIDGLISERDGSLEPAWSETQMQVRRLQEDTQQRVIETEPTQVILRLPYLSSVFNLSQFETDLIILALAPELDLRYQKLDSYLQDDVTRKRPSVDLAIRLFCFTFEERIQVRESLTRGSPLLDVPILLLQEDPNDRPTSLLNRSLKLDDRIVEFLLGSDRLDSRLQHPRQLARWLIPEKDLDDLILPEKVKNLLEQMVSLDVTNSAWLCLLYGAAGVGKKACAAAVAKRKNRSLFVLDLPSLVKAEVPFPTLLAIAFREAQLYPCVVYLDRWQEVSKDESQLAMNLVELFKGLIFFASHDPWQPDHPLNHPFVQIELPTPNEPSRYALWRHYLSQQPASAPAIDHQYLASAFRLNGGQIQRAITFAQSHRRLQAEDPKTLTTEDLLEGCRLESSRNLIALARKIEPERVWSDLVLPNDILAQLQELYQQVRHRMQVYTHWGFDRRLSLGKGLIALFTGDSGTGKTLSAEVLAKELSLDLYRVDLSLVVSKYIGETEKNLSRLFQEAYASNAILFFDEADALLGKRSEIKDAHDRYANIEVNYLLQRVEEYEGVIILASNLSRNIDDAFVRRLHFSIEFPFPDEYHRLQIWRDIFPTEAPLAEDLDFEFLARQFKLTGGNIKNVALAAAFRAAEEGSAIEMKHLILGMRREYQKLGKVCDRSDFQHYYEWIR